MLFQKLKKNLEKLTQKNLNNPGCHISTICDHTSITHGMKVSTEAFENLLQHARNRALIGAIHLDNSAGMNVQIKDENGTVVESFNFTAEGSSVLSFDCEADLLSSQDVFYGIGCLLFEVLRTCPRQATFDLVTTRQILVNFDENLKGRVTYTANVQEIKIEYGRSVYHLFDPNVSIHLAAFFKVVVA